MFYSGGTNNSDPVSIYSYGTISGATDLYIDGNMYSGTTNLLEIFSTASMSGTVVSVGITGTDGIEVDSGSPITDSGTITLGLNEVDATKIADGSVTDTEFQYINTLSSNAQTQLSGKLDLAGGTMEGAIAMSSQKITGLGDPTSAQDAVTKAYADSINYWSANTDGSISPSGSTTDVEIGGNFIADGSSNDLELKNAGSTNILLRGRGNQTSYIGGDSSSAKVGIGIVSPNERLTVVGNISASTSMLTPVVSATTLTLDGHAFISGDTKVADDVYVNVIRRYSSNDTTVKNKIRCKCT